MKTISLLISLSVFLFFCSCSSSTVPNNSGTTIDLAKLNKEQVSSGGPEGPNLPGRCYTKLTDDTGYQNWYEIFCESQKKYFNAAQAALVDLGYLIDSTELSAQKFGLSTKAALVEFQQSAGLSYGALDQATLYQLIARTQ